MGKKITRIEDVQAWQAARELQAYVYDLTGRSSFSRHLNLLNRIRNASASSMANINEGFEAGKDAEFARFLGIAKRSAGEVQTHLYVARDRGLITEEECKKGRTQADVTMRLIGGFIRCLTKPPNRHEPGQREGTRAERRRGTRDA